MVDAAGLQGIGRDHETASATALEALGAGCRPLQTCAVVVAIDVGDLAVVSGRPPYCDGLTTGEVAPIVLKDVACLITWSVGPADVGRLPSWQAVRRGRGLKSLTEKRRFQPSLVC